MTHRRRRVYTRSARLLKRRLALLFAPKISDFDLDRPRLGLSERQVASQIRPQGDVTAVSHTYTNRAGAAATAPPMTRKDVS